MTAKEFIQEIVQEGCTAIINPIPENQFIEGGIPERSFKIIIHRNFRSNSFILSGVEPEKGLEMYLKNAIDFVGRNPNRKRK